MSSNGKNTDSKRRDTHNFNPDNDQIILSEISIEPNTDEAPLVPLHSMDALWFQVGGTICNLWCTHCFISCSPENHKFGFMSRDTVQRHLAESKQLGVKEYYFTGGEPFMNKDLSGILEDTLAIGPATVLTNGILIHDRVARQLKQIVNQSIYSLVLRVSVDGFTEETNDKIRGKGSFRKAMNGVKNLVDSGFSPIITAAQTWKDSETEVIFQGFREMLQELGYARPRFKIIPPLRIGREKDRSHGYDKHELVTKEMMADYDDNQLQCTHSRMVTDKGVYVCPILIDNPEAKVSDTLADSFTSYPLKHQACYTCYLSGAICHNTSTTNSNLKANVMSQDSNGKTKSHMPKISVEKAVRERYEKGASAQEAALCCAVDYDKEYLNVIPKEIIERDYGCGDPSKYVRPGETVLDLGSGTGKICYVISQMVGPEGNVIGVDINQEMLSLSRSYLKEVSDKIGYQNVAFHRGKIQDLKLNLDKADLYLRENPIRNAEDLMHYEEFGQVQKLNNPLIPDNSIDLVVSNCVLNLVNDDDKKQLFAEIYRILKVGGRVAISDIVSDEDVPEHMKNDPQLWSGCISGALKEDEFLNEFANVGFYGIQIEKRDKTPWQIVEGIEFRSVTITAYKGKEGPCLERNQAVIYRGPWKAVIDDDGHTLHRGERMAVCDKTFNIYSQEPYANAIIPVAPHDEIPVDEAEHFACNKNARRHPKESKGQEYKVTKVTDEPYCSEDGCC